MSGHRRNQHKRERTSPDSGESSASSDPARPGFVYDPVRKRYFRAQEGAPNNNFTIPTELLLPSRPSRRYPWTHPSVVGTDVVRSNLLLSDGVGCLDGRLTFRDRVHVAGFRHNYLSKLHEPAPVVCQWLAVKSKSVFHAVDAFLHGPTPKVFYVSESDSASLNDGGVECRVATFQWTKNKLVASEMRRLKAGSILPAELCAVYSIRLFPPGLAFMSCSSVNGDRRMGLCINETTTGIHFIPVPVAHDLVAASSEAPLVATASTGSTAIRLFSFEDMNLDSFSQSEWGGSDADEFSPSSLAFVENDRTSLLVGGTNGQVSRMDYRRRGWTKMLAPDVWKKLGIKGRCIVSGIKSLNSGRSFVTVGNGIPIGPSKVHLWDMRKCDSPLNTFEDSSYAFHRDDTPISISSDDSLMVHSDKEGTTRCWDVDSGCLLAKLPVEEYSTLSKKQHWTPPVAFYSDRTCGIVGQRSLVIATRGLDPEIIIHNL